MLIQQQLSQIELTTVEKTIAQYLLDNNINIKNENVRQIAKNSHTSPSSVMRLCQKLGFQGFSDFKEAYIEELQYIDSHFRNIDPNFPYDKNDKNTVIASKLESLYEETLKDTLSLIHHDSLQKATNALNKASIIYICTGGVSREMANIFKENMLKIGKTVIIYSHMNDVYVSACYCDQNSCFLMISYSGETHNTINVAKKLKERNIPMIIITSYGNNTLSQYSDYQLYISTRQKLITNLGNFSINLSIHYLLDVLYATCFQTHYEENLKNKIAYSNEVETGRKSTNPILKEKS